MKIQCNCCNQVLVDGSWTVDESASKQPGVCTVCPECMENERYMQYELSTPGLNKIALSAAR